MRVLLVSNGNGEAAIAQRLAVALHERIPGLALEHLPLVGEPQSSPEATVVGPRAALPSGGLIAMFNLRNIVDDIGGGLIGLTIRQFRFLRKARGRYDLAIAVGDTFALFMTLQMRAPTIFVGTAKSVNVARYGPAELRAMRKAAYVFVRDRATAEDCRARGIESVEAGNAIVDLHDRDTIVDLHLAGDEELVLLLPGSRAGAYEEASVLCAAFAAARTRGVRIVGALSVAPRLDAQRFIDRLAADGWRYEERGDRDGRAQLVRDDARILLWRGGVGGLLAHAALVLGQAGTANEAAAAAGIAVAAVDDGRTRAERWYRMRQRALLGEAMLMLPSDPNEAGERLAALLADGERRKKMGEVGRERMGEPGAARRIAERAAACLNLR
uniref:Lipid-A-disaccharide synthase n=1 Tax=mine drainage metagenome TaxID=410659 RepID=E6Q772_9ZZZZ